MQNWLGWLMQASELREQLSPVSHTATLPCQSDSNSPQIVCGCVLVPACNSNCTLCSGPKLPAGVPVALEVMVIQPVAVHLL